MAVFTKIAVTVLFGAAAGMNIVNPSTGKCLDLYRPCKGGKEKKGCERVAAKDLKKGANLQMYKCNAGENQQFEILDNGRIRNPLTKLCIDMQAPCKDGSDKPDCKRVANKDIEKLANIQLWTCHEDTGKLSASYGNQKWHVKENGLFKNEGSGLCLDAQAHTVDGKRVDATKIKDMANVQAYSCHEKGNQIYTFETGAMAAKVKPEEKFQIIPDSKFLESSSPAQSNAKLVLPALGICSLVVAAFVGIRARRSTDQSSPSE